jgi:cytochrome c553
VLAAALSGPAAAQDAARGAALAAERCAACHGEDGRSRMEGIPSLAGQPAGFVTVQMILIREGIRQVAPMAPFATPLTDRQIEDLAAHFAALPPAPPEDRGARVADRFAAGAAVAASRNCGVCHLQDFSGREQVPRLAGQREEFLARAMMEYRDGRRVGADTQMNGAVFGLSDAEIGALAHYLAQRD